MAPQRFQRSEQ